MGKSSTFIVEDGALGPVSATRPLHVLANTPTSASTTGVVSLVSFARTADTNAYTAGDVIGINASGSPGSAIHTFSSVGPSASAIIITGADLTIGLTSVPAGMTSFRLHLYTSSPTAILDNAAFDLVSADIVKHIGYIDLATPVDYGSILFSAATNVNQQVILASASTSLYGELVTVGGYTPASGTTYQMRIRAIAV
jgi:hypothetical protein